MFKLLRWAFLIVVLATVIGLAFLLGLSFGLGNSHGKFISEAVPVLSMLGGWVSGIGALAAVLTTLWLADKQRREDVESLRVTINMSLIHPDKPFFITVQAVADGKRPATIRGITFASPYASSALHVTGFMAFGNQLPIQLSYGEKADFHLDYGIERQLRNFVDEHCKGKSVGLKVVISTNLNSFSTKVDRHYLSLNS
ncbi:hypothetical protein HFD98_24355 [Pseudomonas sp. EKM23D]|uniref:hypothetical protein n=1 Tax=Pseudomonas sp. EKM23D TaxID=2708062 RepID=UPI00142E4A47|nr:hypothetical protein [Pseudomonas sp. EKM23D]KAF6687175.1 hypothetical protein HFD98_24355 [Pseudomonas sp. EKM23D]